MRRENYDEEGPILPDAAKTDETPMPEFKGLREQAVEAVKKDLEQWPDDPRPTRGETPEREKAKELIADFISQAPHQCVWQIISVDEIKVSMPGPPSGGGALDARTEVVATKTVWIERCRICRDTRNKETVGAHGAALRCQKESDKVESDG